MASRRMRSRGCDQCKKRRVKCDETGDFCRQCLRFGLDCSGPIQGVKIVDMTIEAALPRDRASLDQRPRKARKISQPLSTPSPANQSELSDISGPQPAISALVEHQPSTSIVPEHRTPTNSRHTVGYFNSQATIPYQPSNAGTFEIFLIKQFLDFSRLNRGPASPTSWLTKLPEWILSSQLPAFRCSIRASTIALHALLHRDIAAQKESCRWYVASLNRFRIHLKSRTEKGLVEGNPNFAPEHEEILIPMFLCLFEAFTHATPAGIIQHLDAASKIVVLRGPHKCKSGIYHQMFVITRISNTFISIVRGHQSSFATLDWRTIPFEERGKPLLHQLVDIILSIRLCLEISGHNGLINLTMLKISKSNIVHSGMKEKCYQLIDELQKWWKTFESSPSEASTSLFLIPEPTSLDHQEASAAAQYSPTLFIHRDTLTSFSVSLYSTANLILHTILQALAIAAERLAPHSYPFEDPTYHLKQVKHHANLILHIAAFHQRKGPNVIDFMRNVFSLKIVELLAPPEYSIQAKALAAKSALKRPETPTMS